MITYQYGKLIEGKFIEEKWKQSIWWGWGQSKQGRETKGEKKKVRLVVRECANE